MAAPVLFLESASGHEEPLCSEDAIKTVNLLIQTLRRVRRLNAKISLNSKVALTGCEVAPGQTLQMLLAGPQHHETWLFLKEFHTKSPFSEGFEKWLSKAELFEAKTICGQPSEALAWAILLETGTISFHTHSGWLQPWVSVDCLSLDEDGEEYHQQKEIPNASVPSHVDEHQEWLKTLGFEKLPSAKQFWMDRESQFAGLRFLACVKNQINDLATSGAPYKQALKTLEVLNQDSLDWDGQGIPVFSIKEADGEHDQRRQLSNFYDDLTDTEQEFGRHIYFTGGIPGRIHFRLSPSEKKFVVAYVGFKL
ncbi:hypothetical protein RPD76_23700 [Methylomonas sp. MV1]|uniref:hypothetical protein n=1 Tax=Methylomonas sp. MV1 TaxID=3073620 RepID=UPI0028A5240D|nr:hypothetical protein [Methylomonas sp. MV1]MDT4332927.1 hypothetical protein [Methylomonas sp. MV1]